MNPEKKNDDEAYDPFMGVDKGSVLQEKRIFNESPINPRKCCHLITKILYLLGQGQTFTKTEATDLFFATTMLFQSTDVNLRRMVYLVLKELLPLAEDVIIVISCLTKDMNSKTDLYRANAIRVLCKINDVAMLGQAERYLKQAIVDREAYVASAALVSGMHLMKGSPAGVDIVKRWFSEVQSAVKSKSTMVQYHALGLLHQIKRNDRLAVSKLVSEMTRSPVRSHYAHCLLIRYTCQVLEDESDDTERGRLYDYLESCLRHKSEVVIYEAARGICGLRTVSSKELTPAVAVLQMFLSSPKASLRFAAVRTLNKVASTHPLSVTVCNPDMENLIGDVNRSIATLAITALLKTGAETTVDRLMKQITNFINDISDEFKIVVVDAIKTLCLKYKQKHRTLMTSLANMLRDEGGYQYKKAIVDAMLTIIAALPEAKEPGLAHLCEFIEDCEFTQLSTRVLNLLGREGPTTSSPSKYIRYIYNRLTLESANVRAAALSALAKFALGLPALRPSISILLSRCLHDSDDEVRDRATLYLRLLQQDQDLAQKLILDSLPVPLDNLERCLKEYAANPSAQPFDIAVVPVTPIAPEPSELLRSKYGSSQGFSSAFKPDVDSRPAAAQLPAIPELAALGPVFKSSAPQQLTESETEYVVNCVKHVFAEHVVFQFNCTNTLDAQVLENVVVKMDASSAPGFKVEWELEASSLVYGVPGAAYVCASHDPEAYPTGSFGNVLKFQVKDVDPATGEADETGYEDQYPLDNLDVTVADYMKKTYCTSFKDEWAALGEDNELVEIFALSTMKSLKDAVNEIIDFLGMQACDKTEVVPPKRTKHILLLSGSFVDGNAPALVRIRMKMDDSAPGVSMELTVRSTSPLASRLLSSAF